MLLWANASVSLSETPTKPQKNADLSSCIGQPGICRSTGLSSCLSDFCWLVSSLPDSHLLTDSFSWLVCPVDCLWDLPSLILFRSRGRSRARALCVGFAPKQTKGSSEWLTRKDLHSSAICQIWKILIVFLMILDGIPVYMNTISKHSLTFQHACT